MHRRSVGPAGPHVRQDENGQPDQAGIDLLAPNPLWERVPTVVAGHVHAPGELSREEGIAQLQRLRESADELLKQLDAS